MPDGQAIKNLLKIGIKSSLRTFAPLFQVREPVARILTYHSVGRRRYEMNVTPENFAAQMAWLAANCAIIPLEAAAQGQPGVALTFDDGYRDNLINALPILEHHRIPATLFAVSGCLGGTLPREKEPDTGYLMTPEELREADGRGFIIGGHTRCHPRLAALSDAQQLEEIGGCKSDLEQILGHPVTAFAYPYGSALDYTPTSVEIVRAAGFTLACSNRYGPTTGTGDRFELRRIWIDSTDNLPMFQDKVSGRLDMLRLQDSALGIRARRLLNRRLNTT